MWFWPIRVPRHSTCCFLYNCNFNKTLTSKLHSSFHHFGSHRIPTAENGEFPLTNPLHFLSTLRVSATGFSGSNEKNVFCFLFWSVLQPFKRYVEIGRVAQINYGKEYGRLVVIVDVIDQNRVCPFVFPSLIWCFFVGFDSWSACPILCFGFLWRLG